MEGFISHTSCNVSVSKNSFIWEGGLFCLLDTLAVLRFYINFMEHE
jgi:hypothetical protein